MYNSRLQPCRINVNDSNTTLITCTDAAPANNMLDFTYGYNAGTANNGNVASWLATGWLSFNRSYSYDALNRLQAMSAPGDTCSGLSWTYDAWGNRTAQNVTGGSCFNQPATTFTTQNQFPSAAGYSYDSAGNMTHDGSHTYTYDAENRLTQVAGGNTASYLYDAFGRRVHKTVGNTLTDYVYDLSGNVVTEFNNVCAAVCWSRSYIYLNGQQIAEYGDGTTYFMHKDHLGSTRLVSDVTGGLITDCFDFYPFGERNVVPCPNPTNPPPSNTSHEFTGKERDSESGLDNFGARYNSSSLGRFMSVDPSRMSVELDDPQTLNRRVAHP